MFELTASLPTQDARSQQNGNANGNDHNRSSLESSARMVGEDETSRQSSKLDINYTVELPRQTRRPAEHVFSQILVQRGSKATALTANSTNLTAEDVARMPGTETVVEKYVPVQSPMEAMSMFVMNLAHVVDTLLVVSAAAWNFRCSKPFLGLCSPTQFRRPKG